MQEHSLFTTCFLAFIVCRLFDDGHSDWCEVISHCGFDLRFSLTKSQTGLSDFTFTFHFHALEKEMATHSNVLAWRIPGTAGPGGLPSMRSQSRTRLKRLSSSSSIPSSLVAVSIYIPSNSARVLPFPHILSSIYFL